MDSRITSPRPSAARSAMAPTATVAVWDPFVRAAHWLLAAGVLVAYATGEHAGTWHERLGYGTLILVALRILWGVVGPRYARFTDFVRAPRDVLDYAKRMLRFGEPRYFGHNPLGGWSILALLALVIATGASGYALEAFGENHPFFGEAFEEGHEGLAATLLAFAALHVAGVAWASLRHGENLARAMFTGRKAASPPGGPE